MNFYRASYASAVLAVVILSVRPSVSLSVTRVLWQNQTMYCGYFDTTRKGNHSSIPTPTMIGRRRPLPSEICVQSDPPSSKNADFNIFPLKTSRPYEIANKFQLRWIGSWSRAFQLRAIDGVSTLPLSPPNGGSKRDFLVFWIKFNFNRIKSATKFLCVKTSSRKL